MSAVAVEEVTCACGCGLAFAPLNPRKRFVDDQHRTRARVRRHRDRVRAAVADIRDPEFEALGKLARDAIRAGADPYATLAVLVGFAESAGDARRILGSAG
jgi:hypothetical protein